MKSGHSGMRRFYVVFMLLAMLAIAITPSMAQDDDGRNDGNGRAQRVIPPVSSNAASNLLGQTAISGNVVSVDALMSEAISTAPGRVQVIVELRGRPAAQIAPDNPRSAVATVAAEQNNFVASLTGTLSGVRVIRSVQAVGNFIVVEATRDQVAELLNRPDVASVHPNVEVQRAQSGGTFDLPVGITPDDTTSPEMIFAPFAWDFFGVTGEDILIGVVDSGIDYTHTHFGGPGDYSVVTDRTAPTVPGLFPAPIPNTSLREPKVIGGFDYVGDAYTGPDGGIAPAPNPNPIDCPIDEGGGHGTHVAGTAAGYGVTDTGATYGGAYDAGIFPDFPNVTAGFRMGPGIAPEALLAAFKVFGCNGSTSFDIIMEATEDAVLGTHTGGRQVDVLNFSLGAGFGSGAAGTMTDIVANNAIAAGTVLVYSAGNSGDAIYAHGTPGSANAAISVASYLDTTAVGRGIQRNNGPGSPAIYPAAVAAFGPFVHPVVTAPGQQPPGSIFGCFPGDFAGFTGGNIAVISRGDCAFVDKANNAFAAGASALIVYNNDGTDDTLTMAPDGIDPAYNIPSYFIGGLNGADLLTDLSSITIDPLIQVIEGEDPYFLSTFSSRGPTRDGRSVKPDIAAPGNTIVSAGSGSGDQPYVISGTSMAAPHVAGAAALVIQDRPGLTPQQVKALLVNNIDGDSFGAPRGFIYKDTENIFFPLGFEFPVPPQRGGSGGVDLFWALWSDIIAFDATNPDGVSVMFGNVTEVLTDSGIYTESRQITIQNLSGSFTLDTDLSIFRVNQIPGASVNITPGNIVVPPGGTGTVTLTVTFDPNAPNVNLASDPTMNSVFGLRHWIAEESGFIYFDAGIFDVAVLPYYFAPRPASNMQAAETQFPVDVPAGQIQVPLTGADILTGFDFPLDIVSVVTAFELIAENPASFSTSPDSQLQYVGVASDYMPDGTTVSGDPFIYLAYVTRGDWSTLNTAILAAFIDVNGDGIDDWLVRTDSFFVPTIGGATRDIFVTTLIDLSTGVGGAELGLPLNEFYADEIETYLFNNNVVVVPVPIEFLRSITPGVDPNNTEIGIVFAADSFDNAGPLELVFNPDDPTGFYYYDYVNPAIFTNDAAGSNGGPFAGMPGWLDLDGNTVPVDYDFANAGGRAALDVLLLHHHNAASANVGRAEVITIFTDEIPIVTGVVEAGGVLLVNGLVTNAEISEIDITFNVPVQAGMGPDGADNPDNYRLLKQGAGGVFLTDTCDAPIGIEDITVDYDVSYDVASRTSTLTITGPAPLPPLDDGVYRLMVCGSTSIVNDFGIPLDGTGDGVPGDDFVLDFVVTSEPIVDPGDPTDPTAPGVVLGPDGQPLQPEDLGITELPATGETPLYRNILLALLAMGAGLALVGGTYHFARR